MGEQELFNQLLSQNQGLALWIILFWTIGKGVINFFKDYYKKKAETSKKDANTVMLDNLTKILQEVKKALDEFSQANKDVITKEQAEIVIRSALTTKKHVIINRIVASVKDNNIPDTLPIIKSVYGLFFESIYDKLSLQLSKFKYRDTRLHTHLSEDCILDLKSIVLDSLERNYNPKDKFETMRKIVGDVEPKVDSIITRMINKL